MPHQKHKFLSCLQQKPSHSLWQLCEVYHRWGTKFSPSNLSPLETKSNLTGKRCRKFGHYNIQIQISGCTCKTVAKSASSAHEHCKYGSSLPLGAPRDNGVVQFEEKSKVYVLQSISTHIWVRCGKRGPKCLESGLHWEPWVHDSMKMKETLRGASPH